MDGKKYLRNLKNGGWEKKEKVRLEKEKNLEKISSCQLSARQKLVKIWSKENITNNFLGTKLTVGLLVQFLFLSFLPWIMTKSISGIYAAPLIFVFLGSLFLINLYENPFKKGDLK